MVEKSDPEEFAADAEFFLEEIGHWSADKSCWRTCGGLTESEAVKKVEELNQQSQEES